MAEIYLARRETDGALVAVKRILPHLVEDPQYAQMFVDEARITSQIVHPNVCQVFELGRIDDAHFLAMEYLEGATMSRLIALSAFRNRRLDVRFVVTVMIQACAGLQRAHGFATADGQVANLVHRDISPHNLFVTAQGLAKVLDFGIAKIRGVSSQTRTGQVKGKFAYMSPEQILGRALDRRADVFSLGIVCHEALSGNALFHRENDYLTLNAVMDAPIPRLSKLRWDVPPELDQVVQHSLRRRRDARYQSAALFAEALGNAIGPLGGAMSPDALGGYLEAWIGDEIRATRAFVQAAVAHAPEAVEGGRLTEIPIVPIASLPEASPAQSAEPSPLVRSLAARFLDDEAPADAAPGPRDLGSKRGRALRMRRLQALSNGLFEPPPPPRRVVRVSIAEWILIALCLLIFAVIGRLVVSTYLQDSSSGIRRREKPARPMIPSE
jgi:hypothetical protein